MVDFTRHDYTRACAEVSLDAIFQVSQVQKVVLVDSQDFKNQACNISLQPVLSLLVYMTFEAVYIWRDCAHQPRSLQFNTSGSGFIWTQYFLILWCLLRYLFILECWKIW